MAKYQKLIMEIISPFLKKIIIAHHPCVSWYRYQDFKNNYTIHIFSNKTGIRKQYEFFSIKILNLILKYLYTLPLHRFKKDNEVISF